MKSTFTVLFIIQKGKPKADGRVPIMARITINGKMSHFSTKFDILPERWLPKECKMLGQTPDEKIINQSLDALMVLVKSRYNEMVRIGETLTADKLKNSVMGLDTNATRLLEYFDTHTAHARSISVKNSGYVLMCRAWACESRLWSVPSNCALSSG